MLDDKDINKLTLILATKKDFLDLRSDVNGLQSELKSFKTETREHLDKIEEKIDDLTKVVMSNHNKRIEVLEEKVLV